MTEEIVTNAIFKFWVTTKSLPDVETDIDLQENLKFEAWEPFISQGGSYVTLLEFISDTDYSTEDAESTQQQLFDHLKEKGLELVKWEIA